MDTPKNDDGQSPPENEKENARPGSPESPIADVAAIGSSLIDSMPEPSEHAIEADREKREAIRAEYADLRDTDGNSFDPDIHVTDDDGAPKLTKNGKLRKRPGRKAKGKPAAGSHLGGVATDAQSSATLESAQARAQARASGIAAANTLITLGVALGGDEWRPVKDERHGLDERAQLEESFAAYFEAKGMTDIPPGVALTLAVGAYALPRFTMPKTQTRMQRAKEWLAVKWAKRQARKGGKKNGAQSDTGNDRERKDDAGKATK